MGFLGGSGSNESACSAGDLGSICGSERSPGEGNGNPLWYSCLGNPTDQGAWWATVHGVARVRHNWATDTTHYYRWGTTLVAQIVESLPEMQETQVQALGREDPLEKEMATHSSVLAWEIPRTEKPGGHRSVGPQRVRHNRATDTYRWGPGKAVERCSQVNRIYIIRWLLGWRLAREFPENCFHVFKRGNLSSSYRKHMVWVALNHATLAHPQDSSMDPNLDLLPSYLPRHPEDLWPCPYAPTPYRDCSQRGTRLIRKATSF